VPKPITTVRLRRLAAELKRLRESEDLSQEDVCERTGMTRSTLYRIENGQRRPQRRTLIQLLDLYGVEDPQRGDLLTLLKESGQRGWMQRFKGLPEQYSTYISFEAEAQRLRQYESQVIPGLLQTEDYAREVIRGVLPQATPEEIDERVAVRMERQAHLTRDHPLELWAIMDEAALRRTVGGREVMKAQLRRLIDVAALPYATLQAIPFGTGAHPGMMGAFLIIDFPDPSDPSVVCIENGAGNLFLEDPAEIRRYDLMYDHLQARALSPEETGHLMDRIAKET
jgi:transcriptional regulator with XRE-family HTH domain